MKHNDTDILETTHRMIERFGVGALREIELRIRELKEHGETEAAEFWLKVRQNCIETSGRKSD